MHQYNRYSQVDQELQRKCGIVINRTEEISSQEIGDCTFGDKKKISTALSFRCIFAHARTVGLRLKYSSFHFLCCRLRCIELEDFALFLTASYELTLFDAR
jgi:hypothetical protein